jgi:hypothetical protein
MKKKLGKLKKKSNFEKKRKKKGKVKKKKNGEESRMWGNSEPPTPPPGLVYVLMTQFLDWIAKF